jgi:hypothetical protein
MERPALLIAISALIAIELNHLRWWTYWNCKRCGVVHKQCSCGHRKWVMYL